MIGQLEGCILKDVIRLYDLAIVDIVIPKMNGFIPYDEIRRLG
jgi:hypothetical protein